MPELISPTSALQAAWREAHAEWGPGLHEDGFGLLPGDDAGTPEGFEAWLQRLAGDTGCTYRWIVEDGAVLGGIGLRYGEGEAVRRSGNIGYGIRPSKRCRGYGVWALRAMLAEARHEGLAQVLVICAADNAASARTIERAGGVPQDTDAGDGGRLLRYLIATG